MGRKRGDSERGKRVVSESGNRERERGERA